MQENASISEEIIRVGDEIFDDIGPSGDVLERAADWKSLHGLSRLESPDRTLCRLAAFNRLLKLSLYELLQDQEPRLNNLTADTASQQLEKAHDYFEITAFDEYILDEIANVADEDVLRPLVAASHRIMTLENPPEDLGRIFKSVVPQKARRKLGQFRTPENLAELMAKWSIREGDDQVLDPGMGAGVLTSYMYQEKVASTGNAKIEQMWGLDLSELSVVMSTTALKLVNGDGVPQYRQGNFIDFVPEGGQTRLSQDAPQVLPRFDAIVSNPPYTRHHDLSDVDKEKMHQLAESHASLSLSKRSPAYLYFFIHASQFLDEDGRMAFLTPLEFLQTNYGKGLKKFLLDNFSIHGVITHEADIEVFDGARTSSCITLLERSKSGNTDCTTTFIELSDWPGVDRILDAVSGDVAGQSEFGFVNHVSQNELRPEPNWTNFTNPNSIDSIPGLKKFGEIATVKRGIATGNNDFFCLSETEVDKYNLSTEYLAPIIRRTGGVDFYNFKRKDWESWQAHDEEVWLLYCYDGDEPIRDVGNPNLEEYLEYGKENGTHTSYLASNRSPWYKVDKRDPAPIFVTYMSKRGFRFIHNEAGLRSLNNLHNVFFKDSIEFTSYELKALLAYLNSSIVNQIVSQSCRTYFEGLQKIEPNEVEEIPVLDPRDLSDDEVMKLSRHFDDLAYVARSDEVPDEDALDDLDEALMEILDTNLRSSKD